MFTTEKARAKMGRAYPDPAAATRDAQLSSQPRGSGCPPRQPQLHSAFHIFKACPPAYKVFFVGAKGDYMPSNEGTGDWSRSLTRGPGPASMLCQ